MIDKLTEIKTKLAEIKRDRVAIADEEDKKESDLTWSDADYMSVLMLLESAIKLVDEERSNRAWDEAARRGTAL